MGPTLPARDPDPAGRAARLAAVRDELAYAWDRPRGVATARAVPRRLGYPVGVLAQVAEAQAVLAVNRAAVRVGQGLHGVAGDAPSTIDSCTALFATLRAPPIAAFARRDEASADRAFAWQRVAGACPFVLERASRLPDALAIDAATFAHVAGGSLDAALAEGRLYVADWRLLEGLEAGESKHLAAPLALFVRPSGERALAPVAIRCAQRPGDAPLLTPSDGTSWKMARLVCQIADANVQESFFHLGRAHFLLEAFAMAMERQLSERHPLHALLSAHFHGTIAINGAARDQLVVPGGQLEELLGPTLEGSLSLVRQALSSFRMEDATLAADLRRRGLDDPALEHPYRDDATAIASAIDAWARDCVEIAYADDAGVAGDVELRAMLAELRSAEGGRIAGVPERVDDRAALGELVSFVIFTASVFHAALNYAQEDWMGWVPNMPTAGYAPPPRGDDADEAAAWSRMLPPAALAAKQLDFMAQQSRVSDDRLGHYPRGQLRDPRTDEPLARLRARLDEAQRAIEGREASRLLPYPYILPSNLTASIHV